MLLVKIIRKGPWEMVGLPQVGAVEEAWEISAVRTERKGKNKLPGFPGILGPLRQTRKGETV